MFTVDDLLSCAPVLEVQLVLVVLSALFWKFALDWVSTAVVEKFVKRQPWKGFFLFI